jgi:hypothetical protein
MRILPTSWTGRAGAILALGLLLAALWIGYGVWRTERLIAGHVDRVAKVAAEAEAPRLPGAGARAELPAPVRRWLDFTFPGDEARPRRLAYWRMEGRFRRPHHDTWAPMTAEQRLAAGRPAFVFDATTWPMPGLWARAMDAYAGGDMDMKARILSAITAVDEVGGAALNRTSVQRWLLESALAPSALLPSERVRWEAIDADTARAVVTHAGAEAAYRVTFDARGAIRRFDAEHDGRLDQPYHGAGEHAMRGDYREVGGVMVPTSFTIARVIDGAIRPFWEGRVTALRFDDPRDLP